MNFLRSNRRYFVPAFLLSCVNLNFRGNPEKSAFLRKVVQSVVKIARANSLKLIFFENSSCIMDFASYEMIWNNDSGSENPPIFHPMFLNVLVEKSMNIRTWTYIRTWPWTSVHRTCMAMDWAKMNLLTENFDQKWNHRHVFQCWYLRQQLRNRHKTSTANPWPWRSIRNILATVRRRRRSVRNIRRKVLFVKSN